MVVYVSADAGVQQLCCCCCRYLRRIELNKLRAKGEPKPGEYACVVVTDIEGYSSEALLSCCCNIALI
jgi:hypothetical protein